MHIQAMHGKRVCVNMYIQVKHGSSGLTIEKFWLWEFFENLLFRDFFILGDARRYVRGNLQVLFIPRRAAPRYRFSKNGFLLLFLFLHSHSVPRNETLFQVRFLKSYLHWSVFRALMSVSRACIRYLGSFKCIKCSYECIQGTLECIQGSYECVESTNQCVGCSYGMATVSRIDEIIGLFFRIASLL